VDAPQRRSWPGPPSRGHVAESVHTGPAASRRWGWAAAAFGRSPVPLPRHLLPDAAKAGRTCGVHDEPRHDPLTWRVPARPNGLPCKPRRNRVRSSWTSGATRETPTTAACRSRLRGQLAILPTTRNRVRSTSARGDDELIGHRKSVANMEGGTCNDVLTRRRARQPLSTARRGRRYASSAAGADRALDGGDGNDTSRRATAAATDVVAGLGPGPGAAGHIMRNIRLGEAVTSRSVLHTDGGRAGAGTAGQPASDPGTGLPRVDVPLPPAFRRRRDRPNRLVKSEVARQAGPAAAAPYAPIEPDRHVPAARPSNTRKGQLTLTSVAVLKGTRSQVGRPDRAIHSPSPARGTRKYTVLKLRWRGTSAAAPTSSRPVPPTGPRRRHAPAARLQPLGQMRATGSVRQRRAASSGRQRAAAPAGRVEDRVRRQPRRACRAAPCPRPGRYQPASARPRAQGRAQLSAPSARPAARR
jgi:hypothetical protein